jgi:site-specific recombinase XerD
MLTKSFSLLFYLKKPKHYEKGPMPIYLRITVDRSRREISTGRHCMPEKWNSSAGRANGKTEEIRSLNADLEIVQSKVYEARRDLLEKNESIEVDTIKELLRGTHKKPKMLLEIFQQHNEQMKNLVGKDFSAATLKRYKTSLEHTRAFLLWWRGLTDLDIRKLDFEFICQYEFWFKTVRNCNHNSTMKYINNLKKIVNWCLKNRWLKSDPFIGFKMTKKEVIPEFLNELELNTVAAKKFSSERLTQVRDIFLFCCYTGLAFVDVKKLKPSEISLGIDGNQWIFTSRQKTDTLSRIPLLPVALKIIDTYANHPACINFNKVLPVLSNQKYNEYLKEIATICGVNKKLTTHTARHTFATTVTLCNGVPIESVSKMLGHKDLKTTQHYARVLDKKISEDMQKLKDKLITVGKVTDDEMSSVTKKSRGTPS